MISAEASYFLYNPDKKLSSDYSNTIEKTIHHNELVFGEYQMPTYDADERFFIKNDDRLIPGRFIELDFAKDANGETITKGHKLYNIAKAIQDYKEGEDFWFNKYTNSDLFSPNKKEINTFNEKGKHFCAGYLDQFDTQYNRAGVAILETIIAKINKLLDYPSYSAAKKVMLAPYENKK